MTAPQPDLVVLSDVERSTMAGWARRRKPAQALALRARIVLACAQDRATIASVSSDLDRTLRRSPHRSVTEFEADIRRWTNEWNTDPTPFVWTKTADAILDTLAGYCHRLPASGGPA